MTKSRRPGSAWRQWQLVQQGAACKVIAIGTARQDLGPWSSTYPAVWAVSFSGIHRTGTYRLVLTKHPDVISPWFRIAKAAALYRKPLANALSFYQNERDGPDFIPSKLRTAPAHRNDSRAMTYRLPKVDDNGNFKGSLAKLATGLRINATGGWFDAGDYLHFTETTSYTVGMLLQAVAAFPRQTGSRGQVNFSNEAKFGVDFLRRMWNEKTRTLYVQVGTGEANSKFFGDHDIWRLPQADDHYLGTDPAYQYIRHPPVFRAGKPGAPISPNLAGRLSADFALCYRVYRATDPGYANSCLRSAETIYAMAALHWRGHLETALPWDFYPETSWRDDLMLGATELALALRSAGSPAHLPAGLPVTKTAAYLADAAHWAKAWFGSKADGADTLNLYDVSALADYELYRAITIMPGQESQVTRPALLADLHQQIRHAITIGTADPFDYGFAWDQWDTTAHGLGLAVMAGEYDALVRQPVYAAWGQRQLDGVFGANAWGISLVVGDGTVYPDCMQHQVANLAGSDNGSGAGAGRSGRRRPEQLLVHRLGRPHEGVPHERAWQRAVPGLRRPRLGLRGQRPVVRHSGAGHRPDRAVAARLRLARGGRGVRGRFLTSRAGHGPRKPLGLNGYARLAFRACSQSLSRPARRGPCARASRRRASCPRCSGSSPPGSASRRPTPVTSKRPRPCRPTWPGRATTPVPPPNAVRSECCLPPAIFPRRPRFT